MAIPLPLALALALRICYLCCVEQNSEFSQPAVRGACWRVAHRAQPWGIGCRRVQQNRLLEGWRATVQSNLGGRKGYSERAYMRWAQQPTGEAGPQQDAEPFLQKCILPAGPGRWLADFRLSHIC